MFKFDNVVLPGKPDPVKASQAQTLLEASKILYELGSYSSAAVAEKKAHDLERESVVQDRVLRMDQLAYIIAGKDSNVVVGVFTTLALANDYRGRSPTSQKLQIISLYHGNIL